MTEERNDYLLISRMEDLPGLHFVNANEAWKLSRHLNEINPNVSGIN